MAWGRARFIFSLLIASLAITPAFAGINAWSPLGPEGGRVDKIVFHPTTPSIVYAHTPGGLYRSVDGGVLWQQTDGNGMMPRVQDFALDPAHPNRIYAVACCSSASRLYVSNDSGATFSRVSSYPATKYPGSVAVSADGLTLYVFADKALDVSIDGGQTWQARANFLTLSDTERSYVDPSDASVVFAKGFMEGMFVSRDRGVSWQSVLSSFPVYDLEIEKSAPFRVWIATASGIKYSDDKGVSWQPTTLFDSSSVAVSEDGNTLYAVAGLGRVMRSVDRGVTWTQRSLDASHFVAPALAIHPGNTSHVLLGGHGGIDMSTDAGSTWFRRDGGIHAAAIAHTTATTAQGQTYLSGSGLYVLDQVHRTVARGNVAGLFSAMSSASSSLDPLTLVPGTQNTLLIALGARIARSTDGGDTWAPTSYSIDPHSYVDYLTASSAPGTVYATSRTQLHKSIDGGLNWQLLTPGLRADLYPGLLAAAPSDPNVLYLGTQTLYGSSSAAGDGIYKSVDGGLTWSPANASISGWNVRAIAVHPRDPKVVYAILGSSMLMRSVDGGSSWTQLSMNRSIWSEFASLLIDPDHPDTIYVAGQYVVQRSLDRGDTWQSIMSDDDAEKLIPGPLIHDSQSASGLFIGTAFHGVQHITFSPDLQLQREAPASPLVASAAVSRHQFKVRNNGPFDTAGVEVTVNLSGVRDPAVSATGGGVCSVTGRVAKCSFDVLRLDAEQWVAVDAMPDGDTVGMSASVRGREPDPVSGNNQVTSSLSVREIADLTSSVTIAPTAQSGATVTYAVTVRNIGPSPASNVVATFQIASGLTLPTVGALVGGSTHSCAIGGGGLVTCSVGTLAATATASFTVSAVASASGSYDGVASVQTDSLDSDATNNSATATVSVTAVPAVGTPSSGKGGGGGGGSSLPFVIGLALLAAARSWRRMFIFSRSYDAGIR